jgi:UDP-glucose 4-epimerase
VSTPVVVLVTGVSRYLGAQVAARLAAEPRIMRVIGVDSTTPSGEFRALLSEVEVCTLEPGTPELVRLLTDANVEAVAHLAIATSTSRQGGRAAMKEHNVIGTMQLLAACQQAPWLRKLVVRSSSAAYGASFRDPAVFTEETEAREIPRGGFAKDVLDIEGYVRGFHRRRPDVVATVLRFAPMLGQGANTNLARYFALPVVPTVIGRDPRLQFVHVDDALEILHRSLVEDHAGTFNVAGTGVLTLNQAIRRSGRIAAPVPEQGLSAVASVARGYGGFDFSHDQLDLFVHGRVVDVRRLVEEFGFQPRPTAEAFDEFVRGVGCGPLGPDRVAAAERAMLDRIRAVRAGIASRAGDAERTALRADDAERQSIASGAAATATEE